MSKEPKKNTNISGQNNSGHRITFRGNKTKTEENIRYPLEEGKVDISKLNLDPGKQVTEKERQK